MPIGLIRRFAPLLTLYASKAGALFVGLLIFPQFSKLLGSHAFGIVAVILAMQQLLLTLDLGMAVIVGRELALTHGRPEDSDGRTWRSAEALLLFFFFLFLLPVALVAGWLMKWPMAPWQIASAILLCAALTCQNISQIALLAKRDYFYAAWLQVAGVALRGIVTLVALNLWSATLSVFLISQLAVGLIHWWATRVRCVGLLTPRPKRFESVNDLLSACWAIALQGRHLVLSGIAGAALMQLDKPIVSTFVSAAGAEPYFLAMALCLTPLTALAWPVSQYFHPRLVSAIGGTDASATEKMLLRYVHLVCIATIVPTAILWVWRDTIVAAWLGDTEISHIVADYCSVLLPGVAVGALGYVPYSILVAHADYKFQSRLSVILSIATLAAAAVSAARGSVTGVCAVYAVYFSIATGMTWLRAAKIRSSTARYAGIAAGHAFILSSVLAALVALLAYASKLTNTH